jgi:hypothetical protein
MSEFQECMENFHAFEVFLNLFLCFLSLLMPSVFFFGSQYLEIQGIM